MLNIGAGEITLIMVVALLVLGPKRLPELARGLGKFVRAFRRQTDEVRTVIEREFYRMDQDIETFDVGKSSPPPALTDTAPAHGADVTPAEPGAATSATFQPPGTVPAAAPLPIPVTPQAPASAAAPSVPPDEETLGRDRDR
ncbi:MAG TPA: twin-arginine translocase TatA/TatE family subunit [Myxococcaceae bacterium]|nr:twin-arginine translocase TatA/TatE family subunit [Myxococcaceae bacterium]